MPMVSMENVYLALIVAVPAMLSPLLLSWLTNRNSRRDREQEWERQDRVAERAAEASRKLLARQDTAIAVQEEALRAATTDRALTQSQLKALHTLGNSGLTAALKAELNSTRRELTALREIMTLKVAAGRPSNGNTKVVIEMAERRIEELETNLADRKSKDELATAQVEEGATAAKITEAVAVASKPAAEDAARKVVPPVVTEVVPPVVKAAVKEALAEHDKKDK